MELLKLPKTEKFKCLNQNITFVVIVVVKRSKHIGQQSSDESIRVLIRISVESEIALCGRRYCKWEK